MNRPMRPLGQARFPSWTSGVRIPSPALYFILLCLKRLRLPYATASDRTSLRDVCQTDMQTQHGGTAIPKKDPACPQVVRPHKRVSFRLFYYRRKPVYLGKYGSPEVQDRYKLFLAGALGIRSDQGNCRLRTMSQSQRRESGRRW